MTSLTGRNVGDGKGQVGLIKANFAILHDGSFVERWLFQILHDRSFKSLNDGSFKKKSIRMAILIIDLKDDLFQVSNHHPQKPFKICSRSVRIWDLGSKPQGRVLR